MKRELRRAIRRKLGALDPVSAAEASRAIRERLFATPEWRSAEIVLAFVSMPGEVDTGPILSRAFESGKTVALPRVEGSTLLFHIVPEHYENWELHSYGMREPARDLPVLRLAEEHRGKALVVTPGLAFDRTCGRLGRGGGFYDGFLASAGPFVISAGVCFSVQLVDEVPRDEHDRQVDMVVSEHEVIYRDRHPA
jgi:5-formyltetrahydrofolate cyclo-ligase